MENMNRIHTILRHIHPSSTEIIHNKLSQNYESSSESSLDTETISSDDEFNYDDVSKLSKRIFEFRKTFFPPEYYEAREKTITLLRENPHIYNINYQWSPKEKKEMTHLQFKHFTKTGILSVETVNTNLFWFLGVMEVLSTFDISVLAKIVIHYQLFGSCLWRVGTEKHRKILADIDNGTHCCSFSMTEIAHGSNVRALETEAVFDPSTKEFIIHTPSDSAVKMWIGNTAFYGTLTIVFAQLIINGERKGVHAFLVPLRDPHNLSRITPGVVIKDLGAKNAWEGVDNSLIRFNHVRVPLDNLLNRFGSVLEDGTYVSPIKSESDRFARTLAALLFGRLLYIVGPTIALQNALTISIRYACQRQQFGEAKNETYIWNYPSHQLKLVPPLAYSWAFFFTVSKISQQFANINDETLHDFHTLISSVKAYICEYTPLQLAKIANTCGGHGVHRDTRLGELLNEMFPFQIAEGDSIVLYQQTAKDLLDKCKQGKIFNPTQIPKVVDGIISQYPDAKNLLNGLDNFGTHLIIFILKKRLEILLQQAFTQIAKQQSLGISPGDAFTSAQETLLDVSRSFVELHLVLNFASQVINCIDHSVRVNIVHFFNLFAIEILHNHLGYLVTEDIITISTGKELRSLRSKLIENFTRDDILDIVNGFMIPDFLLRASIGKSDMNYITNLVDLVGMPRTEDF